MSSDKRERGGVGPGDGDVGQDQEPAADEAMVAATDLLHIAIGAARLWKLLNEIVVVAADEEHDGRAYAEAYKRAKRPCDGEKRRTRHDERAPTDGAAERKRHGAQRREIRTKPAGLFVRRMHLPPPAVRAATKEMPQ